MGHNPFIVGIDELFKHLDCLKSQYIIQDAYATPSVSAAVETTLVLNV